MTLPVTDGASSASPRGHRPDRGDQVVRRSVLEQEPGGAGTERGEHVLVEVERGQRR